MLSVAIIVIVIIVIITTLLQHIVEVFSDLGLHLVSATFFLCVFRQVI